MGDRRVTTVDARHAGRWLGRRRRAAALGVSLVMAGAAMVPAQAGAVGGRVTDASTDSAVAGAFVLVEGMLGRTVTDANGRYLLRDVEPGQRLVRVLRVGYEMAEHTVVPTAPDHSVCPQRDLDELEQVEIGTV